jgi:hypothetical protein
VAFEHRGFHEGIADVIDLHLGIHDVLLWIIRKTTREAGASAGLGWLDRYR